MIFEEPRISRPGPKLLAEPLAIYFATSTRAQSMQYRSQINDWYGSFPDESGQVARQLRSHNDRGHLQARDEVYVHHVLKDNYRVTYEEPGGSPNFCLYKDGDFIASIEVASLFDPEIWLADARKVDELVDDLNRRLAHLVSSGFLIDIEIRPHEDEGSGSCSQPLSQKELSRWLEELIETHPISLLHEATHSYSFADGVLIAYFSYSDPSLIRPTDRIVSSSGIYGGEVGNMARVRRTIKKSQRNATNSDLNL